MKILIVTSTFAPDVGGVETMLTNFCGYLTKNRCKTDIITYVPLMVKAKAPLKEKLSDFITVRRIPWIGYGLFNIFEKFPPVQFLYLVPALTLAVVFFLFNDRNKPEVIHAFGLAGAFAAGLASRIFNIPCIVDMCTVYRLPERPILAKGVRVILSWSDYIRANNATGKKELIDIGFDDDRVGIITPPVDESVFKISPQEEAREKLGLPKEQFIALFVGRMVESKGVDIAVSATNLVKTNKITFIFIGEGPLLNLVNAAAHKDARISILNNVEHHSLVDYYNAADILMCASVDKDLISFVGREALMCGLPILSQDKGVYFGISYQINKDLFPPDVGCFFNSSPEGLASCLNELIEFKNKNNMLPFDKNICRRFALKHFSMSALNWIGDSYEKAKQLRLCNKK